LLSLSSSRRVTPVIAPRSPRLLPVQRAFHLLHLHTMTKMRERMEVSLISINIR